MRQLLSSKFELGADASAAAGPVGRHASADTDWKMDAEILTYSRAKGAFAGLTLNGASIRHDEDISNARILKGEVAMPGCGSLVPRCGQGRKGAGSCLELTVVFSRSSAERSPEDSKSGCPPFLGWGIYAESC